MLEKRPFRILVGLDLTEMDRYLIEYVSALGQIFEIEHVTFLHNIKLGDLSRELLTTTVLNEVYQKVKNELQNHVERVGLYFPHRIEIKMEAYSEVAFERLYERRPYDLLIVGRKQNLKGNGALVHKLVQLFPGATMIVPETFRSPIETVIEAITFSKYTESVLGWGIWFRQNQIQKDIKHQAVHVSKPFFTPLIRRSYETDQVIQTDIRRKQEKWNEMYAGSGNLEIISCDDDSIATSLLRYVEEKKADVLILGVKSNSKIRELFMGSVANELLLKSMSTSLLFVKPISS